MVCITNLVAGAYSPQVCLIRWVTGGGTCDLTWLRSGGRGWLEETGSMSKHEAKRL